MKYEIVTQKVLFGNAVLALLSYTFIYREQFYIFCCFRFEKYRPRKPR
jgi:hypothetical protein